MAAEGALATAGASYVACLAFALAAYGTHPSRTGRRTHAVCLFFAVTAMFWVLSATRQVFAYLAANGDPVWSMADKVFFLVLIVPAGASVLPLIHVATTLLWDDRARSAWWVMVFGFLIILGLSATYGGGISGPQTSYWGSEWALESPLAKAFLLGVVTLPALVCSVLILVVGRGLRGPRRRHMRLVGWAFLVYFVVFTTDALAIPGIVLALERLVAAAAALVVFVAYRGERPVPAAAAS